MGCSKAYICRLLSGDGDLKVSTMERIVSALDLSMEIWLLGDSQERIGRGPGRPPGPHQDYTPLLGYAADQIIRSDKSISRALDLAAEWGDTERGLHVSSSTLKRHFYKDKENLLAAARRRLNPSEFEIAAKEEIPLVSPSLSTPSSSQKQPSRPSVRSLHSQPGLKAQFQAELSRILLDVAARKSTNPPAAERPYRASVESTADDSPDQLDFNRGASKTKAAMAIASRSEAVLPSAMAEAHAAMDKLMDPLTLIQIQADIQRGFELASKLAREYSAS
jgi:hypothetical protein